LINSTEPLDPLGHHALRCGHGDDFVKRHNSLRDFFFGQCRATM
jgi:hypothetical protein